jgi:hypothetical protein
MNLVILGVSSTYMGLIPKDWYINNTISLWTFFFLDLELVGDCWNLAHLGGPFMRNSKASCPWLNKTTLGKRERFSVCTHMHAHVYSRVFACSITWLVTCDAWPWRNTEASHSMFCHIKSLQNWKPLWTNQVLINVLIKRWLTHIWMRVIWCINQDMIITQLINIMRINWPSNREDFKLLDKGWSDHHRVSIGSPASILWAVWLP